MIKKLYLASQSPRRLELLQQLNLNAEIINAPVEEVALPKESPESFVLRMAIEKALDGFNKVSGERIWVIGGDTVVLLDGKVFGKPKHFSDARKMLTALSSKTHQIYSAVSVVADGQVYSKLNKTSVTFSVTFRALTDDEILSYWQSGESVGKAGAYAIQGLGAKFIERVEGSYSAVMGLPLFELNELLEESNFFRDKDV